MSYLHQIDPVALGLGPLRVHWYGLMYVVGFAVAWWLGNRRVRQGRLPGVDANAFGDLMFYGLLGVTIGAAAYLAVVPRAFRGVFCIMKKLGSCFGCGRKSR